MQLTGILHSTVSRNSILPKINVRVMKCALGDLCSVAFWWFTPVLPSYSFLVIYSSCNIILENLNNY